MDQGLLPGAPDAFFLSRGEGERAKLFGDMFTACSACLAAVAERLFQQMGTPADSGDPEQPPFIPDFPRIQAAAGPSHAVLPGLRVA